MIRRRTFFTLLGATFVSISIHAAPRSKPLTPNDVTLDPSPTARTVTGDDIARVTHRGRVKRTLGLIFTGIGGATSIASGVILEHNRDTMRATGISLAATSVASFIVGLFLLESAKNDLQQVQ